MIHTPFGIPDHVAKESAVNTHGMMAPSNKLQT